MSRYRFRPNIRQEHFDPARGLTRTRLDPSGAPVEIELADGARIALTRDAGGNLRSLESGDFRLAIDPPGAESPFLRVNGSCAPTEVRWGEGVTELRRGSSSLRLASGPHGFLTRVEIPGARDALVYTWREDGSCTIGTASGAVLATVRPAESSLRVETALGAWEQSRTPAKIRFQAWGRDGESNLSVEVDYNALGRVLARRWSDGAVETFERDGEGRLTGWSRTGPHPDLREYRYQGAQLTTEISPSGTSLRTVNAAGRVLSQSVPDGSPVRYEYDACGRRVLRQQGAHTTRYAYDVLGQMTAIDDSERGVTEMEYDGLGSRVRYGCRREHRDTEGRLWCVTDAAGAPVHAYIWLHGRILARIDGALHTGLSEVYLCDLLGAPIMTLREGRIDRVATQPFGACEAAGRPSLFGHFGDPATGLIHFGAREYDPALGVFLTPDTFDGSAADPRRWAGMPERELRQAAEIPQGGAHPYALCRFDPAGRADLDGHKASMPSTAISVLNGVFDVLLIPTWAWPLTAISLYFFLPLDLVLGELIRGIVMAASGKNRWFEQHTIAKSIWGAGSSRQGIVALGLNGILPRLASSMFDPQADRAVTVGNVIWINSEELDRMDRPTVLEMSTLSTWNTAPGTDSVLHIEGTGKTGKQFHASYWSRGYGNAVKEAAGIQSFDDKAFAAAAGGAANTTLIPVHLTKPFPQAFPVKEKATLKVTEYVAVPATAPQAQAEVVTGVWFALQMDAKSGVLVDDFLEVVAPDLDPIHQKVVLVAPEADFDTVVLATPLPPDFRDKKYKVARVVADPAGVEIAAWANDGAKKLKVAVAAPLEPFQKLLTAQRVHIESAPGPAPAALPGAPAPPAAAPQVSYATVKQVTVKVKLSAPLDTAVEAAAEVFHAVEYGDAATAAMDDPTAAPQTVVKLKWSVKGSVTSGDFVSMKAGAETAFAHVDDTSDTEVTLKLLGPKFTAAGATPVTLKRLKDLDSGDAKATVVTAGADDIPLKFGVTSFAPNNIVHFHKNDTHQFRTVQAWSEMGLELSEDAAGPAPYKVKGATEDTTFKRESGIKLSELTRFLKYKTGKKPDEFGAYPAVIHRFWPHLVYGHVDKVAAQFLAHTAAPPFAPEFRGSWKGATVGADFYFVLDHDLLIRKKEKKGAAKTDRWWTLHADPDSSNEDSDYIFLIEPMANAAPTLVIDIFEFAASAAPAQQGFALSNPRVCVPEHPLVADKYSDALREHELHHALQATHWGPMMGALPLAGLQTLIVDFDGAKDNAHAKEWLKYDPADKGLNDLQGLQYVSIGGIIESTWKYLFTLGKIKSMKFEEWNRILNPFFGNLIKYVGDKSGEDVDPNQPISSSPARAALQLIATVQDLRTWIPFIGFVLLINPDGPRSFLEQGASRASGDLYSTILSADDNFNRQCSTRINAIPMSTSTDANLEKPLGELARLMVFPGSRDDRVFPVAAANSPCQPPLAYDDDYNENEMVTVKPQGPALFHPALYERIAPGAAVVPFKLDGPLSAPAAVEFDQAAANDLFRPRLRALTPLPPQVLRTAGFYFIPVSTGKYDVKAYFYADETFPDGTPGTNVDESRNAKTQDVTLNFSDGKVKFGDDALPYEQPPASPNAPVAKAPLARFLTEQIDLTFGDQFTGADPDDKDPGGGKWEINLHTAPLAVGADLLRVVDGPPKPHGWKLEMGKTVGQARVRVFRVFQPNNTADDTKNDHAFDMLYDGSRYPSLKNVRSYLDKSVWIVVRDFVFDIKDLPKLTADGNPVTIDSSKDRKFDLPLALPGEGKPVIASTWDHVKPRPIPGDGAIPVPVFEKVSDKSAFPKGQVWRMKPLDGVIEEDSSYKVSVTYGADPFNKVQRDVAVTITPVIRLKGSGAALQFEASPGQACTLTIEGGAPGFSVDADLPGGVEKTLTDRTLTITVKKKPAQATTKVVVTVADNAGNQGRRTISVRNT